jgi:hypothetical protein
MYQHGSKVAQPAPRMEACIFHVYYLTNDEPTIM